MPILSSPNISWYKPISFGSSFADIICIINGLSDACYNQDFTTEN